MQQEPKQDAKSATGSFRFLSRRQSDVGGEKPVALLEYWKVLKRRRYLFALPTFGIILAVVIYALNMQAVYRSEATILIEDQEIPEVIIGATITNYASQQIQLVNQRLFTVKNIGGLISKFRIYDSLEPKDPFSPAKLAKMFREDMELKMVSAEVFGSGGRPIETAVAFTLAFSSPDPDLSRDVAQELVTLFLGENQRISRSRAAGVSALLVSAIEEASEELLKSEADLTQFKVENEGALPELIELNLNVLNRSEGQLSDVNLRLGELEQRKLQLSVQLSSLRPSAPVTLSSGEVVMGDEERLRSILMDYRRKSAIYQSGHPDLVRLEREIETLRKTVRGPVVYSSLLEQLRQERDRLGTLRDRYSADHPDIKNLEAAIAKLESQLAATDRGDASYEGIADNPAYVLIKTQLQSVDLEVASLVQKRRELLAVVAEHESLIKQTPHVEMQYDALLRTRENAETKHSDLQARLRAAEVASDVEQEITGQRFALIEPPALPLKAEPRHRAAIGLLGMIIAFSVGGGCLVFAEVTDESIRGAESLTNMVGVPPLAVIGYLDNNADIVHARIRRVSLVGALFAGSAITIAYIIYFL